MPADVAKTGAFDYPEGIIDYKAVKKIVAALTQDYSDKDILEKLKGKNVKRLLRKYSLVSLKNKNESKVVIYSILKSIELERRQRYRRSEKLKAFSIHSENGNYTCLSIKWKECLAKKLNYLNIFRSSNKSKRHAVNRLNHGKNKHKLKSKVHKTDGKSMHRSLASKMNSNMIGAVILDNFVIEKCNYIPDDNRVDSNKPADNRVGNNKPTDNRVGNNKPDDNRVGNNEPDDNRIGNSKPADNRVGNNKPTDNRIGNSKPTDNRVGNNKPDDNRVGNNEPDDNRIASSKPAGNRVGNNKLTDNRIGNSKPTDNRVGNNKPADNRVGNNKPTVIKLVMYNRKRFATLVPEQRADLVPKFCCQPTQQPRVAHHPDVPLRVSSTQTLVLSDDYLSCKTMNVNEKINHMYNVLDANRSADDKSDSYLEELRKRFLENDSVSLPTNSGDTLQRVSKSNLSQSLKELNVVLELYKENELLAKRNAAKEGHQNLFKSNLLHPMEPNINAEKNNNINQENTRHTIAKSNQGGSSLITGLKPKRRISSVELHRLQAIPPQFIVVLDENQTGGDVKASTSKQPNIAKVSRPVESIAKPNCVNDADIAHKKSNKKKRHQRPAKSNKKRDKQMCTIS